MADGQTNALEGAVYGLPALLTQKDGAPLLVCAVGNPSAEGTKFLAVELVVTSLV